MTDRPIIFSAPMIRALLADTKTQTRRILKPQPSLIGCDQTSYIGCDDKGHAAPYAVGDRLWVREAGNWTGGAPCAITGKTIRFFAYAADADPSAFGFFGGKKRSPIHMPRWASRLTLTVAAVRVERLQDISAADAMAEGIEEITQDVAPRDPSLRFWKRYRDDGWNSYVDTASGSYASLWNAIHGPGAWAANPWVVAITFSVERKNIDAR